MASSSGHGLAAVSLLKFSTSGDPRRNRKKFIQLFKNWCEFNGWYDSEPLPPPTEEEREPPPNALVWLAKGKPMAAFRSPIAGNEELENLVQGFQLSEEERKEPEIILKHFIANEGTFHGE